MGNNKGKKLIIVFCILLSIALLLSVLLIINLTLDGNTQKIVNIIAASVSVPLSLGICAWTAVAYLHGKQEKRRTVAATLERHRAEQNALEYKLAAEHANEYVLSYDIESKILNVIYCAKQKGVYQRPLENVPDSIIGRGLVAEESLAAVASFFDKMKANVPDGECTLKVRDYATNNFVWYEVKYTLVNDSKSERSLGLITVNKIVEDGFGEHDAFKLNAAALALPEEQIAFYEFNLSKETYIKREGKLPLFYSGTAGSTYTSIIKKFIDEAVIPDDREMCLSYVQREKLITSYYDNLTKFGFDFRVYAANEDYRWLHLDIQTAPYKKNSDIRAYFMFTDIDNKKREELMQKRQNEEDALTHVLNRTTFIKKVTALFADKADARYALLIIDIDNFKTVNDTYGHYSGDKMLIELAQRIRSVIRQDDLVCRLGGDEFMVCLKDVNSNALIEKKAQQLCNALRMKLHPDDETDRCVSASIGISVYPADGKDFDELYKRADKALYDSKLKGKDRYTTYIPALEKTDVSSNVTAIESSQYTDIDGHVMKPKKRMLILDDNNLNRTLLTHMFADEFDIITAENGESAMQNVNQYSTSLSIVLLDIIMPVMDGFEVLRQMHVNPRLNKIPVLVISALDDLSSNLKAIEYGAVDFIPKPFEATLVKLRVRSAIVRSDHERIRAQNEFLTQQANSDQRYRDILDCTGTIVFEYDCATGKFSYDERVTDYLSGVYDLRPLWTIWSNDIVTDRLDANKLKEYIDELTLSPDVTKKRTELTLRTSKNEQKRFVVDLYKFVRNAPQISTVILITISKKQN